MADIRNENSRYVVFVLQYETEPSLILDKVPEGWNDDDLKIIRNTKYHGITTQFTGGLKFINDEKDYIESAYAKGGLNGNLYLIKYTLRKNKKYKEFTAESMSPTDLAWEERYRGLADFKTKQIQENELEVKFNSDELEQIIKSYEGDEFELNRKNSLDIDNFYDPDNEGNLSHFGQQRCFLPGRDIEAEGVAVNEFDNYVAGVGGLDNDWSFAIRTEFVTKGFDRHVEVSRSGITPDTLASQALLCYNDSLEHLVTSSLLIKVDVSGMTLDWNHIGRNPDDYWGYFKLQKYVFNGGGYEKTQNSDDSYGFKIQNSDGNYNFDVGGIINFSGELLVPMGISNKTGYSIEFQLLRRDGNNHGGGGTFIKYNLPLEGYKITLKETTRYVDANTQYNFSHINDIGSRLLEIMTGKTHKFYSKFLGRNRSGHPSPSAGVPPMYQDYNYTETGEAGEVAVIHGLGIRNFNENQALYKSITTSFKNYINTLQSYFNVGLGVENSKFGQRARVEKLEHFYRDEIAIKLPLQATKISRKVDANMFVSSASFGSEKGGDYELGIGLDEPNIKTTYSIPLKKTSKKYNKVNKYRSDDVGLEQVRRNPSFLAPKEDDGADSHIWLLDMKGGNLQQNYVYDQLHWSDVLAEQPTGISNPDSYRSWRFTPKRSMLRHSWVLRSGMEQPIMMNKRVSVSSGNSNINLSTRYNDETLSVSEKDSTFVKDLDRARVLPEIIKFTHPLDDDLMDIILGTTTVEIGGENEEVPNFYFKLQFINEVGDFETGYIKSLSPKNDQIELYKANENVILSGTSSRSHFEPSITVDNDTITVDSNLITVDHG